MACLIRQIDVESRAIDHVCPRVGRPERNRMQGRTEDRGSMDRPPDELRATGEVQDALRDEAGTLNRVPDPGALRSAALDVPRGRARKRRSNRRVLHRPPGPRPTPRNSPSGAELITVPNGLGAGASARSPRGLDEIRPLPWLDGGVFHARGIRPNEGPGCPSKRSWRHCRRTGSAAAQTSCLPVRRPSCRPWIADAHYTPRHPPGPRRSVRGAPRPVR